MPSKDTDDWFAAVEPTQRKILLELRDMIMAIEPAATESIKWNRPCYANARGLFCYLHSTRSYAVLGFQQGASLSDPAGLLEGTGKDMRHVKFDRNRRADDPVIRALVYEAARR